MKGVDRLFDHILGDQCHNFDIIIKMQIERETDVMQNNYILLEYFLSVQNQNRKEKKQNNLSSSLIVYFGILSTFVRRNLIKLLFASNLLKCFYHEQQCHK